MRVECLSEVRAEGRIRPKSSQARRAESAAPASPAAAKCADPIVFVARVGFSSPPSVAVQQQAQRRTPGSLPPLVAHPRSLATPPPL
eukprot:4005264-Pyramimonas_sp.AAC.1